MIEVIEMHERNKDLGVLIKNINPQKYAEYRNTKSSFPFTQDWHYDKLIEIEGDIDIFQGYTWIDDSIQTEFPKLETLEEIADELHRRGTYEYCFRD